MSRLNVSRGDICYFCGLPFGEHSYEQALKCQGAVSSALPAAERVEREFNRYREFYPDEGGLCRGNYPRHMEFFKAGKQYPERLFLAGNRVGKSEGVGGYELTLHLTGLYPDWWEGGRFNKPVKAWAAGLMQSNMSLPVVQRILGHSTHNLTASFVSFAEDDIRQVAKVFLEKESWRKTSARNTFFGKSSIIHKGDIQAKVELVTIGGDQVTAVITNDSLARLGLKPGSLITAEVKAPSVVLQKGDEEPKCTAENKFRGIMARITRGQVTTEYVVHIADGTELCSLATNDSRGRLDFQEKDSVWAIFSSFSVVLHID